MMVLVTQSPLAAWLIKFSWFRRSSSRISTPSLSFTLTSHSRTRILFASLHVASRVSAFVGATGGVVVAFCGWERLDPSRPAPKHSGVRQGRLHLTFFWRLYWLLWCWTPKYGSRHGRDSEDSSIRRWYHALLPWDRGAEAEYRRCNDLYICVMLAIFLKRVV